MEKHLEVCPFFPVKCTKCDDFHRRCDGEAKCTETEIPCPFAEYGCRHRTKRRLLQDHMTKGAVYHVSLLAKEVFTLKKVIQNNRNESERKFSTHSQRMSRMTNAIQNVVTETVSWAFEYDWNSQAMISSPGFRIGHALFRFKLGGSPNGHMLWLLFDTDCKITMKLNFESRDVDGETSSCCELLCEKQLQGHSLIQNPLGGWYMGFSAHNTIMGPPMDKNNKVATNFEVYATLQIQRPLPL